MANRSNRRNNHANSWSGRLAATSPRVWAVLYAAVAILFAFGYLGLSRGHFTQSTLRYEEDVLRRDTDRLKAALSSAILRPFGDNAVPLANGWSIPRTGMMLADLRVSQEQVTFTVLGSLMFLDDPENSKFYAPMAVFLDFDLDPYVLLELGANGEAGSMHLLRSDTAVRYAPEVVGAPQLNLTDILPEYGGIEGELMFEPVEGSAPPATVELTPTRAAIPSLILSSHEEEVLQDAYRALHVGDPLAASSSFLRMLYFSIGTIAIGGFGDIAPVSTSARLLVMLETVIGIVIIGLFLNSLAADDRRR